jgi:hypothetical protein
MIKYSIKLPDLDEDINNCLNLLKDELTQHSLNNEIMVSIYCKQFLYDGGYSRNISTALYPYIISQLA